MSHCVVAAFIFVIWRFCLSIFLDSEVRCTQEPGHWIFPSSVDIEARRYLLCGAVLTGKGICMRAEIRGQRSEGTVFYSLRILSLSRTSQTLELTRTKNATVRQSEGKTLRYTGAQYRAVQCGASHTARHTTAGTGHKDAVQYGSYHTIC